MTISFDQIPRTNRVPGTYAEVDGSRAVGLQPGTVHRALLIGLMMSDGLAAPGVPVRVDGELSGDALFGTASQLAGMAKAFKEINRSTELYAVGVLENGAGVAATSTIVLTGAATEAGALTVRVGDLRVSIASGVGQTAEDAATALAAAINAEPRALVTAAAATDTVTLTSRHKGENGNAVTIATERAVAGLTAVDAQPVNGATNPSLASAIAGLDDSRYDTTASGISDAANVTLLENEAVRRWGPFVKLPGHIIVARRGSLGTLSSYGAGRNSAKSTAFGTGLSPTPPWIWAAQVAARDAEQTDLQPNRPRNGLSLPGCEAPRPEDRFDIFERNQLLYDGISTFKVDQAGQVQIERLITTYQTGISGTPDVTYLSIETVRTLAALYIDALNLGASHERDLLGPDGTAASPGVPLMTPKMMRGKLIAQYKQRVRDGWTKDLEGYAAELLVELDTDPTRLNVQSMPRLVGGLVTQAHKLSFQL